MIVKIITIMVPSDKPSRIKPLPVSFNWGNHAVNLPHSLEQ